MEIGSRPVLEGSMERHLLLTVGDDLSSLYGVRFVSSFFFNKSKTKLTLFYVAPRFESMDRGEDSQQHKMDVRLAEIYREKGQTALDASRKLLLDLGFPEANITSKLFTKRFGTVKDIVHEARAGQYDAVVLGRRGYAIFEKAFSTSVSRSIMDHMTDFPIWACRRPESGRKNVLLCVEDSEPSMRIADHVGFMLETEKKHTVTLLHVDTGKGKPIEAIMDAAMARLVENNVDEERIQRLVVRSSRVPKAIMDVASQGQYAAVAVGRGGSQPQGLIERWAVGSRSMKLLEMLEKAALWVSR